MRIKLLFLTVLLALGFNKNYAQTDSFIVYPNPFSSVAYLHFYLVQANTISINLYNAIGTKIGTDYQDTFFTAGPHTVTFVGNSLPNGLYMLKLVINKSKTIIRQIIKSAPTSAIHNEPVYKNDVLLFPNPASGDVNIKIHNFQDKSIKLYIYDNTGRQVFTGNYSQSNFKISMLEFDDGIYTISIPSLNFNYKLILIK